MEEYIEIIKQLNTSELPADQKLLALRELYEIKPVRLCWYLARASAAVQQRKLRKAYEVLQNKIFGEYCYEDTAAVQKLYRDMEDMRSDHVMASYRSYLLAQLESDHTFISQVEQERIEKEKEFLSEQESALSDLMISYLISSRLISCSILSLYGDRIQSEGSKMRTWVWSLPNLGYLKECICLKKKTIIVTGTETAQSEAYILGKCLSEMNCPTWVINVPLQVETDQPIPIKQTLPVSMGNAEGIYGFTLVPSIEVMYNGKSMGNNQAELVDELCGDGETALVLADSKKFEELSRNPLLHNRIENLSGYQEGFRNPCYAFGWAGSYLDYTGQLYAMNTKEAVYRKPVCRFSIVIPVRNSAFTLQHTLHTCLNQRYQGGYEIIISDNSSEGNSEVWSFCQTLQDKRIKYFRTPRDLNLSRSFEFAFLQASGEYIFSLGADDAVLPWTLEVLDQIAGQYPEEEILHWDRGFYAWPGFNKGQENQFCIPQNYQKGNYQASLKEPIRYLSAAMENTNGMYLLPMLYINSCFKRTFFQTLLRETGRLWDGICQDLYMGTVISVIKEKIVYINYPLAIAGMSENSIGAISTLPMENQKKGAAYMDRTVKEGNIGGFSKSRIEALMPELGSDVTSLYNSILRAVNRGLMPAHYLTDVFDWKQWFLNSYRVLSKKDIYFDRKIHQMRYAAMKHGEAFLKWFDENIYEEALTPVLYEEEENPEKLKKTYQEINDGSQIVLDASKYDVHNIYEASLLFERLTGL